MNKQTKQPAVKPHLPPCEQRCLNALIQNPKGIKSYELRELTCCSHVPAVVHRLIKKGYQITCTIKPDGMTIDRQKKSIGWYRLTGFAKEGVDIGKI